MIFEFKKALDKMSSKIAYQYPIKNQRVTEKDKTAIKDRISVQ